MTAVQTLTILLSSVLTGFSESCTCLIITKTDTYVTKNSLDYYKGFKNEST